MVPGLPHVRPEDVAAVAEWLIGGAQRPLFIFGGGAVGGSWPARQLVACTGAASFQSYAGRGVIADDAPLSFGGATLSRPGGSADEIAKADLVIVVGCELAEVDLWRADLGGHDAPPLVRVDIDPPAVMNETVRPDLALLGGDAAQFLSDLLDLVEPHARRSRWSKSDVQAVRAVSGPRLARTGPALPRSVRPWPPLPCRAGCGCFQT